MTPPLRQPPVVLVASPEDRAVALTSRLRELGLRAIGLPTVRIEPPADFAALDQALQPGTPYDWIVFTSARAVRAVGARAAVLGVVLRDTAKRTAAVGPETARVVRSLGLTVDFVPERYLTDEIPRGLGPLHGLRILLPRSDLGRRSLTDELRRGGAVVTEVAAYRAVPAQAAVAFDPGAVDFVALTSASSARFLALQLGDEASQRLFRDSVAACIGPVTAEAARDLGFASVLVAEEHTAEGLVAAIFREAEKHG